MISLEVLGCQRCSLHKGCNQIVPGNGHAPSPLLIVNESSDSEDDILGEPLSGRAGTLFFKLVEKAGINREKIYLTNLVKCHTKEVSDWSIKACKYWLWKEIQEVKPKVIIPLGAIVAHTLIPELKNSVAMKDVADKIHTVSYVEAKIIPWYSPNYLLNRGKAWDQKTVDFLIKIKGLL